MLQSLIEFVTNDRYMPHGYCLQWDPGLVWLHGLSDALIALAYFSIPLTLIYFVRKRRNPPFRSIVLLFAAFILACGTTHVLAIWTLWVPSYGLEGLVKAVTAAVSVVTAIALIPIVPRALALKNPAELETLNKKLEREVRNRLRHERATKKRRREMQRLSAQLVSAQEDVRAAIARDLHDDVKQQISLLAIDIGMLANEYEQESPELTKQLMVIYDSAVTATDSVREITHQLHPGLLDNVGLSAALEGLVGEFTRHYPIEAALDIHQTPSNLSKRRNLVLYRIAQEALQNIAKHANAEHIWVALKATETTVRLMIEDDGDGFDVETSRYGIGLGGMRERARAVDGRLSIVSKKGVGTRITVRVPVGTLEIEAHPASVS